MIRTASIGRGLLVIALIVAGSSTIARAATSPPPTPFNSQQLGLILDIAVDREDPSHLYVATRSGLYRLGLDGSARRKSVSRNVFWSIVSHPVRANILFARGILARGENLGIIVSQDSGETWSELARGSERPRFFRAFDVSKADPQTMYGLRYDVWVSRDGGRTGTVSGQAPDWPIYDVAASSLDPDTVYVASFDGLYVSTDAGRSWSDAVADQCNQPVTAVESGSDGIVYLFSTCQGLLKGNERSGEWSIVNQGFGGCVIQHLAIDPRNNERIYAVVRCNRILASDNGGRNWVAIGTDRMVVSDCVSDPRSVGVRPVP